jgi:hypothetical protein
MTPVTRATGICGGAPDNDLYNESALEAAGRFVFTPGAMTSGPVAVWVSLPFTFRLEEGAR